MTRYAPRPEGAYARHRRPSLVVRLFGRLVVATALLLVVELRRG